MLKGTYSHLNNFSQFIFLILLIFAFLLFSSLIGILVLVPFYDTNVITLLASSDYSDASLVNGLKVIQIFNMVGGLLLPAVLFLWLCSPGSEKYARFDRPLFPLMIVSTIFLILFAQPIIGWTGELNSHLSFPRWLAFLEEWMKRKELQGELITEAFLATTSVRGLLLNVFMIAILPAFAEEILFRGAIASLLNKALKNVHVAVFISAFIFAAIHLQFYGFLPRFLLGTALAYLFFWSGSLWLPVVAHFTNNFLSVMVEFLYRSGYIETNAEKFGNTNQVWLTAIGVIAVSGILYFIYSKTSEKPRQPEIMHPE